MTCLYEEFVEEVGLHVDAHQCLVQGHLWDKLERAMWWMFYITYLDITTIGEKKPKTGTDSKYIVRNTIVLNLYLLFCLRQIYVLWNIYWHLFCLVLGNLG